MDIPQEVLQTLSDTDKQEYEIWQELLNSRGYSLLVEFLGDAQSSVQQTIENANNWDSYVFARGQRDGLQRVLNLKEILAAKVDSIAEELAEASDAEETYDELSVNLDLS